MCRQGQYMKGRAQNWRFEGWAGKECVGWRGHHVTKQIWLLGNEESTRRGQNRSPHQTKRWRPALASTKAINLRALDMIEPEELLFYPRVDTQAAHGRRMRMAAEQRPYTHIPRTKMAGCSYDREAHEYVTSLAPYWEARQNTHNANTCGGTGAPRFGEHKRKAKANTEEPRT